MARRLTIVATSLLTFAVGVPFSTAHADPILITGGSVVVRDSLGIVDIRGTSVFSAQLRLALLATNGPWQCLRCEPGTPVDLTGYFFDSDGSGTVTVGGHSVRLPGETYSFALVTTGGPLVLPFPGTAVQRVSGPFEVSRGELSLLTPSDVLSSHELRGRGLATLDLTPFEGAWRLSEVRYDFAPVPEPATFLLVTGGMAGLVARRRRSARQGAASPGTGCIASAVLQLPSPARSSGRPDSVRATTRRNQS